MMKSSFKNGFSLALAFFFSAGQCLGASGKILRVCDDVAAPRNLDPFQNFSEKTLTIIQQVNEGLCRFDSEGKLEPALAVSWERVNETTVRFNLRKDVFFHNGEPFNSKAVKYSLEHYIAPETMYPGFGFVSTIARVDIVSDHVVDVVTHVPDGLLLNRLAAFGQIVPPQYYKESGPEKFGRKPVGTGPFQFGVWDKGGITFQKNNKYWMNGYPKIDELIFKFIPWDDQKELLVQGKLDIVTELPGTWTLWVMERGGNIIKKLSFYTIAASININSGALKDLRVRKALNHAINKDDLIRYDVFGNAEPIATVSMPGESGHDATLTPYAFDPKKAKELLLEAGYDGVKKKLVLNALVKDQAVRAAKIMRANFSDIGVEMNFFETNDAKILEDSKRQVWDLSISACPNPMAHTFFIQSIMFYSKSPFSLAKNEKFDAMLEEMMTTLDSEQREIKARSIDRYVYEQSLGLFTYQRRRTFATKNKKIKFVPPITGMPHFYMVDINE